jgi:hypothetical protein
MVTRFDNNFSTYPTRTVDIQQSGVRGPYNIPGSTRRLFEVYPKFVFTVDVTAGQAQDARDRWQAFIADCRDGLRTVIENRAGTTLHFIHYHGVDGSSTTEVEVTPF